MGGVAQALSLLFASQTLMATRQRPFHEDLWEGRRRPPDRESIAAETATEIFRPHVSGSRCALPAMTYIGA
jgi:hypothetical protein